MLPNFYPTLVLQDYQYMNKGLADYNLNKEKSLGIGVVYSDALKGTSIRLRDNKVVWKLSLYINPRFCGQLYRRITDTRRHEVQ